jgi:hypothetical protein
MRRIASAHHRLVLCTCFRRTTRGLRTFCRGFRISLRTGRRTRHREQHIQPGSLAQRQGCLGNLVHRVALHQPIAENAVHRPAARIQQPQVIVDLSCRRHRRARIPRRVFLLDGNGRSQPVDHVHIRLLYPLKKLPRIRRKRLHIPPLSLGIDRVEGQRTLPRTRHAADHRQLSMGNLAGDVLQVVSPRAADDDGVIQRESTGKKTRIRPAAPLSPQRGSGRNRPFFIIGRAATAQFWRL